ncbi:Colicin-D [Serratia entomophila]|uniref:S-type pyocin domain-containing protein n=1 Tax=Serratia entomophila TaxID=42906 RepID=UPI00217B4185|nr:S-type pyocin domain-containing protein [Serratia entomophila]CAI1965515.1 Colicin-D [Serratia entomophila]
MSEEKNPSGLPEEHTPEEAETHPRQKRGVMGAPPIKPPVIVITHGPEKPKPGGGGGSLLGQPKPPHDLNEKRRRESEQLARATAKASADALKKSRADAAAKAQAKAKADADARAKARAQAEKLKKGSEERLKAIREADAKRKAERAKADADARAKADADARAKADADARAKADADARAKAKAKADADAKAKADRNALFARAGVTGAPVYTAKMVTAANGALRTAGVLPMSSAPGGFQLAVAGGGSFTLPVADVKGVLDAILSGVKALGKRTPGGFVLSAIFHVPQAGEGSDKVPGRDVPALFAFPASAVAGAQAIVAGMKTVDMPVRGSLVNSNGQLGLQLLKTGPGGLPATVPVLTGVRDPATGLDRITVPAVAGAPTRHILINPAPARSAPSHTGNAAPLVPVTPVHTGTTVKPVEAIRVTTPPVADMGGIQDFIYWRPDAAGTGVEPVYVMLSDPLDSGRFTRKQLDKKYKHAIDFGINDTKKNRETLTKFRDAIESHLSDKETIEKGTYLREKDSKVFFNPKTNNVVILDKHGEFVSGWKLSTGEPQYKNYIEKGVLQ